MFSGSSSTTSPRIIGVGGSRHGGVERAPREGANGTTESEKTNGPTGSTNETSDAEVSLAEVGVLPESFG